MKLTHITLNTCHTLHVHYSPLHPTVQEALDKLNKASRGFVPSFPDWEVKISKDSGRAVFDLRCRGHLATFNSVVWHENKSEEAWNALYTSFADIMSKFSPIEKQPRRPENVPWLATWILPTHPQLLATEELSWVADFEQCLAFSLIQHDQKQH